MHVIATQVTEPRSAGILVAATQHLNLQQALQNIVIQCKYKLSLMNFKKDDNYMSWKMMCIGEALTSLTYKHMVKTYYDGDMIWGIEMGLDLESSLFIATIKAFGNEIYKIVVHRSIAKCQDGIDIWMKLVDRHFLWANTSFLLKIKLVKELNSITR
jgi:hypothetical protein